MRYECVGPVRGSCGRRHWTIASAVKCLDEDRAACRGLGGGSYSDRRVRRVNDWPLTEAEHAEYDAIREAQEEEEARR